MAGRKSMNQGIHNSEGLNSKDAMKLRMAEIMIINFIDQPNNEPVSAEHLSIIVPVEGPEDIRPTSRLVLKKLKSMHPWK